MVGRRGGRIRLVLSRALLGAAALLAAASLTAGAVGVINSPTVRVEEAPRLVLRAHPLHCDALRPPADVPSSSDAADRSASTGPVTATISVPPVVDVVLDAQGRPYAVRTNTGLPPSCGDYFMAFTSRFDTVGSPADLALVNTVMALDVPGSWIPGMWRLLPRTAA